ncbi:MAG TPA: D-2-hydroxyacid dehydrogenase [Candidatus Eisenbacteria bacterium]|jgi:phosphoglycerate dehydrogenase-like enzyme
MARAHVLEWVRYPNGIWNLPRPLARALADAAPGVEVWCPASREEAEARLPEADIVLGFAVRPENFARASRLKWIHCTAASVTGVLFPALVESDVVVTNARGLHGDAMAEHALGVMLAFARKLHHARDAQRAHEWSQAVQWTEPPPIGTLAGSTLGLVGLGAIGSALAVRARALGMRVIAVRRHPAADPAPAHAQWAASRLGELLAEADWVVLAAPHTPETVGLIGAAELARMKPGARLVNLGRGALVDEPALVAALQSGKLAGAALDVFAEEPLPAASSLWDLPEVIVTPHTSGLAPRYWERAMAQFTENLERWLAGAPLRNVVDKRAGY